MNLRFSSRKWHAWISFALSLPILLVAVTAILISHSQALGFRDIKFYPAWLPGHAAPERRAEAPRAEQDNNARRDEQPPASPPREREFNLARLIKDLHTGDALFGREGRWIWNDIVGGAMAFLALTGIYLWWNGQRKMVFSKRMHKSVISS